MPNHLRFFLLAPCRIKASQRPTISESGNATLRARVSISGNTRIFHIDLLCLPCGSAIHKRYRSQGVALFLPRKRASDSLGPIQLPPPHSSPFERLREALVRHCIALGRKARNAARDNRRKGHCNQSSREIGNLCFCISGDESGRRAQVYIPQNTSSMVTAPLLLGSMHSKMSVRVCTPSQVNSMSLSVT